MQFINPTFLYALGFLAIPIAIHLFNFRRPKKVVFSDIRFLKQILQQNKKQRQIKHYLILLLRLLALSALVFAFANPFIPKGKNSKQSDAAVLVYIDNSFSMNASGDEASLLELAKNKARAIVNAYGESHSFQLLTNDFESRHRINYNKKDVLKLIDEVKVSAGSKSFSQVFSRQKSQAELGTISYWIGDAQKSQSKLNEFVADSNSLISYLPLKPENTSNVWIDTAYITDPIVKKDQLFTIKTSIRNGSGQDLENQSVALVLDGNQKAIQTFSCKAGAAENIEFQLKINDGNWHNASIKITDYPIAFDDEFFFTFKVSDQVQILQVFESNPNPSFAQLYVLDPTYQLNKTQVQSLKYSELSKYNLIILDGLKSIGSGLFNEMERFVKEGGIVAVLSNTEQVNYNESFAKLGISFGSIKTGKFSINKIETNDPIFKGVFNAVNEQTSFPEMTKGLGIQIFSNSNAKVILANEDASVFLLRKSFGKGQFYIAANDLSQQSGNFSQHAFFVPLFLNMPFQVKARYPWSYQLGKNNLVPVLNKEPEQTLKLQKNKQDWTCEIENREGNLFAILPIDLNEAGFYQLKDKNNIILSNIALNYPRIESKLNYHSTEDLTQKGLKVLEEEEAQLSNTIQMEDNGISLWRYFLFAAFVFFLIEMLLLRTIKS